MQTIRCAQGPETCKKLIGEKDSKSNTFYSTRGVGTDQKVNIKALWAGQAGKTQHRQCVSAPLGAAIIG